jgi:hypothetical protein
LIVSGDSSGTPYAGAGMGAIPNLELFLHLAARPPNSGLIFDNPVRDYE